MEKQFYLVVKAFVYFGYNYPNRKEIIHYMCEKTGKLHLEEHLQLKFDGIIEQYGSYAAMNMFFIDLDTDLRTALVDYALKVYAPKGFRLSDDDKKLLGI